MKLSDNLRIALQIAEAEERGDSLTWEIYDPDTATWREPAVGVRAHLIPDEEIRLKPRPLGRSINGHTLAEGQEWHRQDWTQEMLPYPYRPLLLGEEEQQEDEYSTEPSCSADDWTPGPLRGGARKEDWHRRTTRPLPTPASKYSRPLAPGEAFANPDNVPADKIPIETPLPTSSPLKKTVPLGPEDVPPGSVIYDPSWPKGTWELVCGMEIAGVRTRNEYHLWRELVSKGYQISRDNGKTWEPCTKEIDA